MGTRVGHAALACILSGLLIALAWFLQPVGVELAAGSAPAHRASAAEPGSASTASPKSAPATAKDADDEEDEEDGGFIDPMGPNSACYVCHMAFVFEEISKVHLAEKVTCVECHGLSAAHANDENIGATKPDKLYKRCQINEACRKCHEEHDVKPEEVVARWIEKGAPKQEPVCTDCHGEHRIEHAEEEEAEGEPQDDDGEPEPNKGEPRSNKGEPRQ